jgi:hypothetical protein
MMKFTDDVQKEIAQARKKFAPIHSLHEGFAVLLEEFVELWDRVRMKKTNHEGDIKAYRELVQLGAMAQRVAEDVIKQTKG